MPTKCENICPLLILEIAKIVWQSCNFHENINKLQKRNKNQQETSSKILGDYKFILLNNFEKN